MISSVRTLSGLSDTIMVMILNYSIHIVRNEMIWFYRGTMVTRVVDFLCDLIMYSLYIKLLSWFLYIKIKLRSHDGRLAISYITWVKIYWVLLISVLAIANQLS